MLASTVQGGEFLTIWRRQCKEAIYVEEVEDGRVFYRILTGFDRGERFSAKFDPSQLIDVYGSRSGAVSRVTRDNEDCPGKTAS